MNFGIVRTENFEKYRDIDYGFEEVTVENPPDDFVSTSSESSVKKGYLLDTSRLADVINFGNGSISNNTVTFDEDDVIVYDKNGTVYYAKGYLKDGELFYNTTVHREK